MIVTSPPDDLGTLLNVIFAKPKNFAMGTHEIGFQENKLFHKQESKIFFLADMFVSRRKQTCSDAFLLCHLCVKVKKLLF